MKLTFLGSTGTVTGSRYLLEQGSSDRAQRRMLVDCGLFQGLKQLRLRNWLAFPVDPARLSAVVLTHAHLDHSGYLPRLQREGFGGIIHATKSTAALCRILLPDSAKIMEEEADHARRRGSSKHNPPLPLYNALDADAVLQRFRALPWTQSVGVGGAFNVSFTRAGHILGAASALVAAGKTRVLFSGDLGRKDDPLLPPPDAPPAAEYVVVESTYGDRLHEPVDPADHLAEILKRAWDRGGSVLVPAFAVGRTQFLMYLLDKLAGQGRLPPMPIHVDSPMASRVTQEYLEHAADQMLDDGDLRRVLGRARYVENPEESHALAAGGPSIILSASGMATGGRVLHHLERMAGEARNTILFTGYQAAGTRGADLVGGAKSLKIYGRYVEVTAAVETLKSASAHADAAGIVEWLGKIPAPPRKVFVTHGEPAAAEALRKRIARELHWDCEVPEYRASYEL